MEDLIKWLLDGDISIQYITHRDLLGSDEKALLRLQNQIGREGFAAEILSCRNRDGHWGLHYYQPKWTSTHYTLLDLKNLCLSKSTKPCRDMVARMFDECETEGGGIDVSKTGRPIDIAVNGMILQYAVYFREDDQRLERLLDLLLAAQKTDGGWTWDFAADVGEPHTTICVMEGVGEYISAGLTHRISDAQSAIAKGVEFLLSKGLFMAGSDKKYLKLSYPYRYRYDILRALEFFAVYGVPFDDRLQPGTEWVESKRNPDGTWHLENVHKGKVHIAMESLKQPSRFLSEKALFIFKSLSNMEPVAF